MFIENHDTKISCDHCVIALCVVISVEHKTILISLLKRFSYCRLSIVEPNNLGEMRGIYTYNTVKKFCLLPLNETLEIIYVSLFERLLTVPFYMQ